MTTEAALVIVAIAVALITLLTYLAGRAENRRAPSFPADGSPRPGSVEPGSANEAAHADVTHGAGRALGSERDVLLGDGDADPAADPAAHGAGGRLTRAVTTERTT